jgi:hypothetical protein
MIGSFTHFPEIGSLSPSLGLGAIGMPGYAHFCLVIISILITLWHLFQIFKGTLLILGFWKFVSQKKEML